MKARRVLKSNDPSSRRSLVRFVMISFGITCSFLKVSNREFPMILPIERLTEPAVTLSARRIDLGSFFWFLDRISQNFSVHFAEILFLRTKFDRVGAELAARKARCSSTRWREKFGSYIFLARKPKPVLMVLVKKP